MSKFLDKRRFAKRVPKKAVVYAGRMGDGSGNVEVTDLPNYVYCRIGDKVEVVYNDKMPLIDDLAVDVGRDATSPEKFQILGARSYAPGGGSPIQTGYAPAIRYEWMAPGGGQDPVYIHNRAIKYLRLGRVTGMTVEVQPGLIWTTAPKYVSYQTLSMTTHIPAGAGDAAIVLITINTSGTVVATKGAEFVHSTATTAALMMSHLPAIPASTAYVTGAVRVYNGQTAVYEGRVSTDIFDFRFTGINTANTSISAHAATHISTGSDPIDAAVAGGASGLLTGTDKTKLDGIAAGATKGISVQETDGAPNVANVTTIKVTNGTLTDDGSGTVTITTGGGGGSLTVEEIDGSPSVANVNTIKFTNGSVTDNTGGVVTVTTGGAGASGDGWTSDANTWSYSSADAPTFVISVNADMTAVLSVGMRIKLTQTTAKYFIVTAVGAFSAGATPITVYGGTDYALANAAITSPYYSTAKAPLGFPTDPAKWQVELTDTSDRAQASPTQNTWYNLGSLSVSVPIGVWWLTYSVMGESDLTTTLVDFRVTLSTANNSESNNKYTQVAYAGGSNRVLTHLTLPSRLLAVTSKTTHYLNARTTTASVTSMDFRNDIRPLYLNLVSAYL